MVDCTLTSGNNRISTHSLLDCGATGFAFVHEQFVSQHNLPRYTLRVPRSLEVIDGPLVLTTIRTANRAVRFAPQTEPCPIPRFGLSQKPNRDATVRFVGGTNCGGSSGSPRFVIFAHSHIIHHFSNTLPPCLFTLFHIVDEHAFYFSVFSPTVANCQVAQFTVFTHTVDVPAHGCILVSPFISRFSCMPSHFASSLFRVVL